MRLFLFILIYSSLAMAEPKVVCADHFSYTPNSKFNVYISNMAEKQRVEELADHFISKKIHFELIQIRDGVDFRILPTGDHEVNKLIKKVSDLYDLDGVNVYYRGEIDAYGYFEPWSKDIVLSKVIMEDLDGIGWKTYLHELRHLAMDTIKTKTFRKTAYRGEIHSLSDAAVINSTYRKYLSFEESLTWKKDSQKVFGQILGFSRKNNVNKMNEYVELLRIRSGMGVTISEDLFNLNQKVIFGLKDKTLRPKITYDRWKGKFTASIKVNHGGGDLSLSYNIYAPELVNLYKTKGLSTLDFSHLGKLYDNLEKQIRFEMKAMSDDLYYQNSVNKTMEYLSKYSEVDRPYLLRAITSSQKFTHPGKDLSPFLSDYYKIQGIDMTHYVAKSRNEEKAMSYLMDLLETDPYVADGFHYYRDSERGYEVMFDHSGRYLGMRHR